MALVYYSTIVSMVNVVKGLKYAPQGQGPSLPVNEKQMEQELEKETETGKM